MEGFHGADCAGLRVPRKTGDGWKTAAKVYTEKEGGKRAGERRLDACRRGRRT